MVGLDVLKRGGNAVDASIAMAAVLNVTEPNMTGVGGDAFMMIYSAKTNKLEGLNASGRAPRALNLDYFTSRTIAQMPTTGMEPVTVPGAFDGWVTLLDKYGTMKLAELLAPAIALGHDYMVLTDHSPRLTVAHGLNRERLLDQLEVIGRLNDELAPFRILTGMEVDILEDGSLDMTDDMLGRLDVVVASVHSKLRMDERPMTARMIGAIANPHMDILGHCTGRLVEGERGTRAQSSFDAAAVKGDEQYDGYSALVTTVPKGADSADELFTKYSPEPTGAPAVGFGEVEP
jgi:hypothetical protein